MSGRLTTPVVCQLVLLAYHQITTLFDFFPFNGSRNHRWQEKLAECGVNGVLMLLPPIGFAFHIRGLMTFGAVYYFVLFMVELILWWVPYLTAPSGRGLQIYNHLLSFATLDFSGGDASARWRDIYNRLHRETITMLPARGDRPVPNLEHMILQIWTLITAIVTAGAYFHLL